MSNVQAAHGPRCPACGAGLTGDLRGGLCPACLVALALDPADDPADVEEQDPPPRPSYRIVTVLAGDEARTTYLAEREGSRTLVTVEIVRAASLVGMTTGLFDLRVKELRRLRHPSIARVLDGRATAEGSFCVVAEYAPGMAINRFAESKAPSRAYVLEVIDQVCEAVGYAHGQHVVHGRLGPSSVTLIRHRGRTMPRLAGFSVCSQPSSEADDIAGLAGIVVAAAGAVVPSAALEPLVRCAMRPSPGDAYPSVAALRDAVARLAGC
jgi:serine/threonine protein kinase